MSEVSKICATCTHFLRNPNRDENHSYCGCHQKRTHAGETCNNYRDELFICYLCWGTYDDEQAHGIAIQNENEEQILTKDVCDLCFAITREIVLDKDAKHRKKYLSDYVFSNIITGTKGFWLNEVCGLCGNPSKWCNEEGYFDCKNKECENHYKYEGEKTID